MIPDEEIKVREMLTSWGLEEITISGFIDNSMDLFAIQIMNQEAIKILIPRLGERLKFEDKWKKWAKQFELGASSSKESDKREIISSEDFDQDSERETVSEVPSQVPSHTQTLNLAEVPTVLLVGEDNEVFLSKTPEAATKSHGSLAKNVKIIVQECKSVDFSSPSAPNFPQIKKIKTYDLQNVLESTPNGTAILRTYETETEFLKDSTRDELADCILQNELSDDMNKTIPHNRFQFLAEQIVQRFPTEVVTTYFEAYRHHNTKKKTAKGKLLWKYYNLRRKFSKCGAITKVKLSSSDFSNVENSLKSRVLWGVELSKSVAGSLCWLEQNRGNKANWQQILEHWKKTSKVRLNQLIYGGDTDDTGKSTKETAGKNLLKKSVARTKISKLNQNTKKEPTLYDYKIKYPVFQENMAYQLFEIDFLTLRPEVDPLALFSEWKFLQSFIVQQIQKKIPDFLQEEDDAYNALTNGEKTLMILENFSKIFPTVNISGLKKGKKSWRPSYAEVNDAFFRSYDFEEIKEERREKLKDAKLTLQPLVAVIGPFKNPDQFIVCIDELFYEVESALQAIDVVFKSFYALHTPYPAEAKQLWLFIQKVVYGINETLEEHFTAVTTLIKEYQRFKTQLEPSPTKQPADKNTVDQ